MRAAGKGELDGNDDVPRVFIASEGTGEHAKLVKYDTAASLNGRGETERKFGLFCLTLLLELDLCGNLDDGILKDRPGVQDLQV